MRHFLHMWLGRLGRVLVLFGLLSLALWWFG